MTDLLPVRSCLVRRTSLGVAGAVAALALALPGTALARGFTEHVRFPNHTPTMNRKWPITVTATRGRAKLSGTILYQFLYAGSVVGHRPGIRIRNGVAHDTLTFPGAAVGHRLTLRVVVRTRYGTDAVNWTVTTRR